jgi:hypothetical protein
MLQAAVAAVSLNPLNFGRDASSITEAVSQMYKSESDEFIESDRPRNALRAAQHVFTDHAKTMEK